MKTQIDYQHAAEKTADELIALIAELHRDAYEPLRALRDDAQRRFCKPEVSMLSADCLSLGFGFSALAQSAARYKEAADNKKYARQFWANRVLN